MIKKILLGLILLGVIGLAAVYFLGSSALNKGIKKGVETFGPEVTQTSVTLDSANISVLTGSGSLKGLNVGNPEGFDSENIFALGEIDLKVDTGSVFSDKIIIDHIIIKQPEISYEKTLTNSNVKELLKNIEEFTGPAEEEPQEPEESGSSKQVVIRKLVIEEGKIYVGLMGVGQTVSLPRIEMNDIGEEGSQMSMAEAIDLVLTKVLQNIGPAIANAGELGSAAVDALKTQGLEKADQTVEKLDEAAGDAVDKATEGIKNLFGN